MLFCSRASKWLSHAAKSRAPRKSRRSSWGMTSLGSSGRIRSYLKGPMRFPGSHRLALNDDPGLALGRLRVEHRARLARAAHQIFGERVLLADAAGEPRRVGHLVERIDVDRLTGRIDGKYFGEGPEDAVVDAIPPQ